MTTVGSLKKEMDYIAGRIECIHVGLQDVLFEVKALDRVVGEDLESQMDILWELMREVRGEDMYKCPSPPSS